MFVDSSLLPDTSRIWIYQSNRLLTEKEVFEISSRTKTFLATWTAHDNALQASFEIRYHLFLILMIDEKVAGASGCSIDKSVHFIQSLEKEFDIELLNRMMFSFRENGNVTVVPKNIFEKLFSEGNISEETIVFNNLVLNKDELKTSWEIPLVKSWHLSLVK